MSREQKILNRIVFGLLLGMLLYYALNNSLVNQWHQPVMTYVEADNTSWFLHALGIPQAIMRSVALSWIFDILMLGSIAFNLLLPGRSLMVWLSLVCLWLYYFMYNSANGHMYHHLAYLVMPIPFLARDPQKFSLLWQCCRYWILFLMGCAGAYKFYYGGFFDATNMSAILQNQVHEFDGWRKALADYFIAHASFAQLFYRAAAVLQLCLFVGLITRRFDKVLFFVLLSFHLGNFILMGIPFWENLLMLLPLAKFGRLGPVLRRVEEAGS